ncbi:MAG: glycosyltransferase family protein [Panacagrimonas sp.]
MSSSSPAPLASRAPIAPSGLAFVEGGGTVLQLSRRRLDRLVAFCAMYEFEDVVASVTQADRVEPLDDRPLEFSRRAYKLVRTLSGSQGLARTLAPGPPQIRLARKYELFFPTFTGPYDLFTLATIPDWRAHCRKAACFVNEYWVHQYTPRYLFELLGQFDHVFVGVESSVEKLRHLTGRPCSHLPAAADVLRFSPLPQPSPRFIDVSNLGRRSAATHRALLRLARERRIHYHYDTVAASGDDLKQRTFSVDDPVGHRQLLGNILQRSRFFIANRARANEAEYAQHLDEIAFRFFEGAAAGAVMLGEAPRTDTFRRLFPWPDAVIHLPLDSADVGEVLAALDAEPKRLEQARRNSLHFAALNHDWVHRLRTVFETLDLPPTAAMLEREAHLRTLAQLALDAPSGTI